VDLLALGRPPRYAHPLLRTAVYDHLPAGVRSHMHQRASDILTAERADPEAVAAHLLRSEAAFSGETISRLRVAAPLALRRGAPEAAVSYLRRALNEGADTPTQTAVLAELGRAELAAGDPAAHGHLMRALAGSSMPPERAAIHGDLSVAVLVTGDQRGCRDLLDEAFRELRGHDPEASAGLECIVAGMSAVDPRFGSSIDKVYPRLRELAGGDTPTAQLARVTLGLALSWCKGDRDGVLRCVEGGFDWNGLVDGGSSHSFGVTWSMQALLGIDELARAATWCARVMEEGAAEGNPYTVLNGLVFKGYAEFRMGLLADAEAAGTSALEQSRLYGGFWVPVVSGFLAETLLERGRQQAAYDLIEGITLPRGVVGEVVDVIFLEARGRLRCARGWWKRGVEDLRESGRLCEVMGNQNPILPPWRASLAAALAQDDKDEALQLAEYDLANARRSKIPRAIGIALRTLAGVYQSDEAIDLLRVAVATLERSPAALDLARALTDLGSALRRQGHRVEAREPLREALEIAARCGAVPL
ncbi:MAG: tetratricopeptide repeat protein, partial [Actinobacteria bacterium]|nr:tetratricopeptide repeat protein [Actinomycetota bacterium]